MSDTLTVGEGRRIVGELLTGLGIEQPKTIDTEQPGDGDPLTVEAFRKTMRGGLRSMFAAVSEGGPCPQTQPGPGERSETGDILFDLATELETESLFLHGVRLIVRNLDVGELGTEKQADDAMFALSLCIKRHLERQEAILDRYQKKHGKKGERAA